MNFKKFISGVSALTIAASAFAGLAISASAATLKTFDFESDEASLSTTLWGNRTVFEVTDSSDSMAPGLFAAGAGKVLRLGVSSSGSGYELGYQADLGDTYTGGINLTFKIEPMQILTTGSSTIDVQFADSDLTPILDVISGTRSNTTLKIGNGTAGNYTLGNYYVVTEELNFYNGTYNASIKSVDGATTLSSDKGSLTAKNLRYLYYPSTNWRYGYCALDDITIADMDGAVTTITVTGSNGETIADAEVTIGSVTVKTNAEGKATVKLPVGDYTISAAKTGTAANEGSTKTLKVADVSETPAVDLTLDTAAETTTITVKYEDAQGNTLKDPTTVDDIAIGATYNATDAEKADIEEAVVDGIHYSAKLSETSPTSIESVTENAVLTLIFDKTEKLFGGTVTTRQNSKVTVKGTSTTETAVEKSYVSNYAGVAALSELPVGTYDVTVTKKGYNDVTTTIEIKDDNSGSAETEIMVPTEDGVLYVEEFAEGTELLNTTGNGAGQRSRDGKYQMYNSDATASFGITETYDKYTVTVPGVALTWNNANYDARAARLVIMSGDTEIVKVEANVTGHSADDGGTVINSSDLTVGDTVTNDVPTAGDLTVTLDTTKAANNLTVVYAGTTYTGTTDATSVTGIRFAAGNQLYVAVSSIKVTGENVPFVPATAKAEWKEDFTSDTDTDNVASLWELEVTAGTEGISGVKVKVDGKDSDNEIAGENGTVISGEGPVVFAIVINKLQAAINSIDAILSGNTTVNAYTAE